MAPSVAPSERQNGSIGQNILAGSSGSWEAAVYGVVSLLDMLEFYSRDYLEISYNIGQMLGLLRNNPSTIQGDRLSNAFENLALGCAHLRLNVTKEHADNMIEEFSKFMQFQGGKMVGVDIDMIAADALVEERMCHHVETIYSVLRAELGSMQIRAIPR